MIAAPGQWTLGELITALEKRPQDEHVSFDFGGCAPTNLASYRGYYEDMALGFTENGLAPTVADLLTRLRKGLCATFTGWKGGEYDMDGGTTLWVANPGCTGSTAIVGIEDCEYWTVLRTKWINC